MATGPLNEIPPIPKGFTLDPSGASVTSSPAPKVSVPSDTGMPPIPPGFTLDPTATAQTPPAPQKLSAWGEFAKGLGAPIAGIEQLAGKIGGKPGAEMMAHAMDYLGVPGMTAAATKLQTEGEPGLNWANVVGNVLSPLNYVPGLDVLGREAEGASLLRAAAQGAWGGAIQPEEGKSDFWTTKAEQTGLGGATGALGQTAVKTVRSALSPILSDASKKLASLGVKLTPGQLVGGPTKAIEDVIAKIPLAGTLINDARAKSLQQFNRVALDEALSEVGEKIPKSVPEGRPSIAEAQKILSKKFEDALSHAHFQVDEEFGKDLKEIQPLLDEMPPAQREQFSGIVKNRIMSRIRPDGQMSGSTFKEVESELTNLAAMYKSSSDGAQKLLGHAIDDANEAMQDNVARHSSAKVAKELAAARRSYAMLSRIEDASLASTQTNGIYMPSQLLRSVRSAAVKSGRRKAYARGDAMLQSLAQAGQDVIPSAVPDSGTAGRLITAAALGGGIATHPLSFGALAAPGLLYADPMLGLVNKWALSGENRATAANVLSALGIPANIAAASTAGKQIGQP